MNLDRRTLLVGGGVGVGLIVGYALWPRRLRSALPLESGEHGFGAYIKIARDGRVTVAVPQMETGQGIWTALPQVVADELGAAWETVAVEPAPLVDGYANPLIGDGEMRITAGSTSVRAFEQPMREAAATAREMLVAAAADRWNVGADECSVGGSVVSAGPRTASFGELAEEAAGRSAPGSVPLRSDQRDRLAGKPLQRLDAAAKSSGALRFASDVRLPGMLYASARLAPPGGQLKQFDQEAISRVPGVRHLLADDHTIAVVADSWWAAERAVKAASPRFSAPASSPNVRSLFERALDQGEARTWFEGGDYDAVTRNARALAATYYVAPAQHLGLEPLSATARFGTEGLEVWAATQTPEAARKRAADAAGGMQVSLYPLPVGEPGGRALEADAVPLVVRLARSTGHPVQLTLSPFASQNHDRPSGGMLARMTALPAANGVIAAWKMQVAAGGGFGATLAAIAGGKATGSLAKADLEGSAPPYAVPNLSVAAISVDVPFEAGYMRGSPEREFAFCTESFIDELAHRAGMEPLGFRMAMLGGNGRLARCLQAAARRAGWDGGGAGSSMGIAGCSAFGSHIGLVASAHIGDDQRIKVDRLVAAVDCGRVINSGLVHQQIEGGLIWALAQASVATPEWVAGMPRARSFSELALPRFGDTPHIIIDIISSDAPAGGVSGLGTTVLAPAVANAIFAATGRRLRSLPFDLAA